MSSDTRERLAALEHEQWAHWMRYLFSRCEAIDAGPNGYALVISTEDVAHWQRQIDTSYADLTEREKDSDRVWADKVLAALEAAP